VLGFLVRRVIWAIVLLLAVSLVTYIIFFVLPAAPTGRGRLGQEEAGIRDAFEFAGPVWEEYARFVHGIFIEGDLGRSLSNRRPVSEIVLQRAPVTLFLIVGGLLMMLLIAIPIGLLSALRPRSLLDRGTMLFVIIGISLHPAWIGLILSYFLGYKWRITPLQGYCDLVDPAGACGGPRQWAYHLLLPWFTFAIVFAAMYARMIRASVVESLREDYVRTARAKGASEGLVLRRHVLRNASMPVVTMLALDIAGGLGAGAFATVIFIENVFGLPGLGGLMLEGLRRRDPPLVLGAVIFVSTMIVLVTLVIDLLYSVLDPRVRTAPRQGLSLRLRRRGGGDEPAPVPVGVTTQ
jgi:peptide/nickel transport system permease protein